MEEAVCQSCGMPLKSEEDYGTNHDHTKNDQYCKYCYHHGHFTQEKITVDDMINHVVKIAVKMGVDKKEAQEKARSIIPYLNRWQQKK